MNDWTLLWVLTGIVSIYALSIPAVYVRGHLAARRSIRRVLGPPIARYRYCGFRVRAYPVVDDEHGRCWRVLAERWSVRSVTFCPPSDRLFRLHVEKHLDALILATATRKARR